jgi:hypothetical protein
MTTQQPAMTLDAAGIAALNDASRALVGGLWATAVEQGGQGMGSLGRYTTDLTTVQTQLAAIQNPTPQVTAILNDITTALNAANATINGVAGTNFATIADAQAALRTAHLDILTQTAQDPALANLGVMALPGTIADPANAPQGTFAEIGLVFNDLISRTVGGISATTAPALTQEVDTIVTGLQNLMAANPAEFTGLTGVHAQAIVNQLNLEKQYISQASTSPFAARGSNDNLADIVDIVQGDTNLANLATFQGVTGFSALPQAANPTPAFQDNADQTNFWADFIAQSNSLGQAALKLVGSGNTAAIDTVIQDLQTFQQNVSNFDAAQGGIFSARFDNELLGATSTTGAEVQAIIQGLQTGNAALVMAGAEQMHANAADVGGNNNPLGGGTYNGDALTVAQALSTATNPAAAGTPATMLAPALPADILALINGGASTGAGAGAGGGAMAGTGAGTGAGGGAMAGTGAGTGAGGGAMAGTGAGNGGAMAGTGAGNGGAMAGTGAAAGGAQQTADNHHQHHHHSFDFMGSSDAMPSMDIATMIAQQILLQHMWG